MSIRHQVFVKKAFERVFLAQERDALHELNDVVANCVDQVYDNIEWNENLVDIDKMTSFCFMLREVRYICNDICLRYAVRVSRLLMCYGNLAPYEQCLAKISAWFNVAAASRITTFCRSCLDRRQRIQQGLDAQPSDEYVRSTIMERYTRILDEEYIVGSLSPHRSPPTITRDMMVI